MKLEKRIHLAKGLTPVETEIAAYILENKDIIVDMNIQELSESIPVSKSAIHRFCKKINLNGFNELKVQLAKDSYDSLNHDMLINVNYPFQKDDNANEIGYKLILLYELTIKDTFDYLNFQEIEQVAKMIDQSSVVDIYTHSHNLNPAENFQDKMLTVGKMINIPKTKYKQRLTVLASDSRHVAIILSYSGKATFIKQVIRPLYEKNIPIILISQAGRNYYPEFIKYSIALSDKESMQDRISQFSSHIAMQSVLDVIYATFFNLNRQKNMEYIRRYIHYMDDRQLD